MTDDDNKDVWKETTWEGHRRAQLRDALKRTVRERLERLDDLVELSRHFRRMRQEGKFRTPAATKPDKAVTGVGEPKPAYGPGKEDSDDENGH